MPKSLAGMHIADVQLDQRHTRTLDGIHDGDAGVGVGTCIKNDAGQHTGSLRTAGFLDRVYQYPFMVALAKVQFETMRRAGRDAEGLDICQGLRAIHGGLTGAEQVEVGTVEDQDCFLKYLFSTAMLAWAARPEGF